MGRMSHRDPSREDPGNIEPVTVAGQAETNIWSCWPDYANFIKLRDSLKLYSCTAVITLNFNVKL